MRQLDIAILSYGQPEKLRACIESVKAHTASEFRCFLIDNPKDKSPDVRNVIAEAAADKRFVPVLLPENIGYAGGVNKFLEELVESEYAAYLDHDTVIQTPGWDEKLAEVMDANAEVGWMFSGPGHYDFDNGKYRECLWSAGFCWLMRMAACNSAVAKRQTDYWDGSGNLFFDTALGHHEEVDFMIRLRLAGWRIGCRPDVAVRHDETATRADTADHKPGGRIHDGVVRWMNKWNGYFCGDDLQYSMTKYDDRALRYTDWNVDALYLERMTLHYFPDWNANPRTVHVPGVGEMDVIEVLKPKGPYKGRAI